MKSFNWGTGISLFFSLFVVIMVFTVIKTTQYDHSLVLEKYYEQDLNYQQQYDKMNNYQQLQQSLAIHTDSKAQLLYISFPEAHQKVEGKVLFFKPDDETRDLLLAIRADENNVFTVSTAAFSVGHWKAKVDWNDGHKGYYKELYINL